MTNLPAAYETPPRFADRDAGLTLTIQSFARRPVSPPGGVFLVRKKEAI
jgi:hypothetical protein